MTYIFQFILKFVGMTQFGLVFLFSVVRFVDFELVPSVFWLGLHHIDFMHDIYNLAVDWASHQGHLC
jgi:hypothetical protein